MYYSPLDATSLFRAAPANKEIIKPSFICVNSGSNISLFARPGQNLNVLAISVFRGVSSYL
jgi:hypothetical protein